MADFLCGSGTTLASEQGRCGFGPRQPLLVISPFATENAVDHNLSNLASMINFVEYNWRLPSITGSADRIQSSTDAAKGVPFDLAGLFPNTLQPVLQYDNADKRGRATKSRRRQQARLTCK